MTTEPAVIHSLQQREETVWINPLQTDSETALGRVPLTRADVDDAKARLQRFAPFIMTCFPEPRETNGIIESPLTEIPAMKARLNGQEGSNITGRLLLKRDSNLAIAGSVKSRGRHL